MSQSGAQPNGGNIAPVAPTPPTGAESRSVPPNLEPVGVDIPATPPQTADAETMVSTGVGLLPPNQDSGVPILPPTAEMAGVAQSQLPTGDGQVISSPSLEKPGLIPEAVQKSAPQVVGTNLEPIPTTVAQTPNPQQEEKQSGGAETTAPVPTTPSIPPSDDTHGPWETPNIRPIRDYDDLSRPDLTRDITTLAAAAEGAVGQRVPEAKS